MQLLLIRHGLPLREQSGDGAPADPPLSERGHREARALAEWLAREELHALYVSPMRRARETALPLAQLTRLEAKLEPRIAEFDRDASIYVPLEELKRTDYPAWRAFMEGGYEESTDLDRFWREVVAGIEEIVATNAGRRVAVVCHGGVINAWAAHLLGLERPLFFQPGYTSVNRFLASGSGVRSIESLNELAHLRGLMD